MSVPVAGKAVGKAGFPSTSSSEQKCDAVPLLGGSARLSRQFQPQTAHDVFAP